MSDSAIQKFYRFMRADIAQQLNETGTELPLELSNELRDIPGLDKLGRATFLAYNLSVIHSGYRQGPNLFQEVAEQAGAFLQNPSFSMQKNEESFFLRKDEHGRVQQRIIKNLQKNQTRLDTEIAKITVRLQEIKALEVELAESYFADRITIDEFATSGANLKDERQAHAIRSVVIETELAGIFYALDSFLNGNQDTVSSAVTVALFLHQAGQPAAIKDLEQTDDANVSGQPAPAYAIPALHQHADNPSQTPLSLSDDLPNDIQPLPDDLDARKQFLINLRDQIQAKETDLGLSQRDARRFNATNMLVSLLQSNDEDVRQIISDRAGDEKNLLPALIAKIPENTVFKKSEIWSAQEIEIIRKLELSINKVFSPATPSARAPGPLGQALYEILLRYNEQIISPVAEVEIAISHKEIAAIAPEPVAAPIPDSDPTSTEPATLDSSSFEDEPESRKAELIALKHQVVDQETALGYSPHDKRRLTQGKILQQLLTSENDEVSAASWNFVSEKYRKSLQDSLPQIINGTASKEQRAFFSKVETAFINQIFAPSGVHAGSKGPVGQEIYNILQVRIAELDLPESSAMTGMLVIKSQPAAQPEAAEVKPDASIIVPRHSVVAPVPAIIPARMAVHELWAELNDLENFAQNKTNDPLRLTPQKILRQLLFSGDERDSAAILAEVNFENKERLQAITARYNRAQDLQSNDQFFMEQIADAVLVPLLEPKNRRVLQNHSLTPLLLDILTARKEQLQTGTTISKTVMPLAPALQITPRTAQSASAAIFKLPTSADNANSTLDEQVEKVKALTARLLPHNNLGTMTANEILQDIFKHYPHLWSDKRRALFTSVFSGTGLQGQAVAVSGLADVLMDELQGPQIDICSVAADFAGNAGGLFNGREVTYSEALNTLYGEILALDPEYKGPGETLLANRADDLNLNVAMKDETDSIIVVREKNAVNFLAALGNDLTRLKPAVPDNAAVVTMANDNIGLPAIPESSKERKKAFQRDFEKLCNLQIQLGIAAKDALASSILNVMCDVLESNSEALLVKTSNRQKGPIKKIAVKLAAEEDLTNLELKTLLDVTSQIVMPVLKGQNSSYNNLNAAIFSALQRRISESEKSLAAVPSALTPEAIAVESLPADKPVQETAEKSTAPDIAPNIIDAATRAKIENFRTELAGLLTGNDEAVWTQEQKQGAADHLTVKQPKDRAALAELTALDLSQQNLHVSEGTLENLTRLTKILETALVQKMVNEGGPAQDLIDITVYPVALEGVLPEIFSNQKSANYQEVLSSFTTEILKYDPHYAGPEEDDVSDAHNSLISAMWITSSDVPIHVNRAQAKQFLKSVAQTLNEFKTVERDAVNNNTACLTELPDFIRAPDTSIILYAGDKNFRQEFEKIAANIPNKSPMEGKSLLINRLQQFADTPRTEWSRNQAWHCQQQASNSEGRLFIMRLYGSSLRAAFYANGNNNFALVSIFQKGHKYASSTERYYNDGALHAAISTGKQIYDSVPDWGFDDAAKPANSSGGIPAP